MTEFLKHLGEHVGAWLYLISAFCAFAEAAILIGMVLPGEAALLVAGYFCHEGVLDLAVMLPVAIVAAIAGDSVGYEFGRKFGPGLRRTSLGNWVGDRRWSTVDKFLHRHGGKAVFLGRMTAVLRALMPSMAGMSGMRYRTFLFYNAAGGILWGGGCILVGWAFASALNRIEKYLTWGPLAALALLIVAAVLVHRRRRARERVDSAS
ncbi:MAG: DedA family protein [Jatrophihabitantaceae bacterium]